MNTPDMNFDNPFNQTTWPGTIKLQRLEKTKAFIFRLYYQHPKLVLASYLSGLIVPLWIFCQIGKKRTHL